MTPRFPMQFGRLTTLLLLFSFLAHASETPVPYVLMQGDLVPLKADFNTAVDQVRLVFIVGPT